MNDCSNADIRDQLPDLLHERLDAGTRAVVVAHLVDCGDCTEELELLRQVLGMIDARTPRVDVSLIVSALPKPRAAAPRIPAQRSRWADWRVAAAVTLLVAGGGSAVILNRGATPAPAASSVAVGRQAAAVAPSSNANQAGSAAVASPAADNVAAPPSSTVATANERPEADLENGSQLGDLNEAQLQTLLKEIDKLPAVPVTDPDPVSLRVNPRTTSSEGV